MRKWWQRGATQQRDASDDLAETRVRFLAKTGGDQATIVVKWNELEYMLEKARKSKGQRATDCGGAVIVRVSGGGE